MPDSLGPQSNEPDTSVPPSGQPPQASTGGASQPQNPAMPPQGGPIGGPPAKELGNQLKMRQLGRAALSLLEEAWSSGTRNKTEEGQVLFKVIGMLSKHFGVDQEEKSQALMSSVRKQMTSRHGNAPSPAAGGQPPQPPSGPIPQPGGAPGAMGGA